jgi:hypothetical protein
MVSRVQEGEQTSESSTGNDTKTEAATGYQLKATPKARAKHDTDYTDAHGSDG